MQLEPTPDPRQVISDVRRRLRGVAQAVAALLAAFVLVALGAADAAATDQIGTLAMDAVEAVETEVEPIEDAVDPAEAIIATVVQPIADELVPILEPLVPIDPIATLPPTEPIDSIVGVLDGLPVLDPVVDPVIAPIALSAISDPLSFLELGSARRVDSAAPLAPLEAAPGAAGIGTSAELDAPTLAGSGLIPRLQVAGGSFAKAGAGLALLAAVLIGLSMAMPPDWAIPAVGARLRPIGLTLTPPVPPG